MQNAILKYCILHFFMLYFYYTFIHFFIRIFQIYLFLCLGYLFKVTQLILCKNTQKEEKGTVLFSLFFSKNSNFKKFDNFLGKREPSPFPPFNFFTNLIFPLLLLNISQLLLIPYLFVMMYHNILYYLFHIVFLTFYYILYV